MYGGPSPVMRALANHEGLTRRTAAASFVVSNAPGGFFVGISPINGNDLIFQLPDHAKSE